MVEKVFAIIFASISIVLLLLSLQHLNEKGFLLNNAYIYASKEERKRIIKRPYYRQSGIVLMLVGTIFLLNAFNVYLKSIGLFIAVMGIIAFTVYYAINSTKKIESEKMSFISNIQYKQSSQSDIDNIYNLSKELIDKYEDVQNIDYDFVLKWTYKKIKSNIDQYTSIYLNETLIGYYHFHEENGMMELDDFYILDSYRNQGIGSIVLKKCIDESNLPIFLYVFIKNEKAIQLYKKFGFEIIENVKETRYIMRKN